MLFICSCSNLPQQFGGTGFLGLFVRFDTYLGTRDNVLHVLVRARARAPPPNAKPPASHSCMYIYNDAQEVKPDSPADLAGFCAEEDYILAADDCVFECACLR